MMSFGVVARIHWQALRVWAKRVPYVKKQSVLARFADEGSKAMPNSHPFHDRGQVHPQGRRRLQGGHGVCQWRQFQGG